MHLAITLYLISWCIIFSYDIYTTIAISILTIILQWLYGVAIMVKTNTQAFQHCALCQKMTPQHFVHCNKCKKCVSIDMEHSNKIGICLTPHDLKRYMYLLHIVNIYLFFIILVTSFTHHYLFIGLVIHLFVIFWTFKESNIKRIQIY